MKRYPEYKDTDVDWLGEVPAHWDLRRLKWELRLITEKAETRERPIALENIESGSGKLVETDSEFEGGGVRFERGDLLFGSFAHILRSCTLLTFRARRRATSMLCGP